MHRLLNSFFLNFCICSGFIQFMLKEFHFSGFSHSNVNNHAYCEENTASLFGVCSTLTLLCVLVTWSVYHYVHICMSHVKQPPSSPISPQWNFLQCVYASVCVCGEKTGYVFGLCIKQGMKSNGIEKRCSNNNNDDSGSVTASKSGSCCLLSVYSQAEAIVSHYWKLACCFLLNRNIVRAMRTVYSSYILWKMCVAHVLCGIWMCCRCIAAWQQQDKCKSQLLPISNNLLFKWNYSYLKSDSQILLGQNGMVFSHMKRKHAAIHSNSVSVGNRLAYLLHFVSFWWISDICQDILWTTSSTNAWMSLFARLICLIWLRHWAFVCMVVCFKRISFVFNCNKKQSVNWYHTPYAPYPWGDWHLIVWIELWMMPMKFVAFNYFQEYIIIKSKCRWHKWQDFGFQF